MLVLNQNETNNENASIENEFTLSDLIGFNEVMRKLENLSAYKQEIEN